MAYELTELPLKSLLPALMRTADALARLDERVSRSPIKAGFLDRQDFNDVVSSLWMDGELVHMEDLVLHDARMDVRAPTQEIIGAHRILRMRRLISSHDPEWPFTDIGLARLRGKNDGVKDAPQAANLETISLTERSIYTDLHFDLEEMDALLEQSSTRVNALLSPHAPMQETSAIALFRDEDWDEDDRLEQWRRLERSTQDLPALLQTAILLDAWHRLEVLQRSPWLGRLLAAALLRRRGQGHLPALSTGLRMVARERRHAKAQADRLSALLEGIHEAANLGLKDHDRFINAKSRMERKLTGRRSNSRLPDLINLVLSRPIVSTSMIVDALGTTPQGAVILANQLELREVTGRGRFRAWGIM